MNEMNYEESVKRLREIIDCLSKESTSLEETATLYKEGMELLRECKKRLAKISADIGEAENE